MSSNDRKTVPAGKPQIVTPTLDEALPTSEARERFRRAYDQQAAADGRSPMTDEEFANLRRPLRSRSDDYLFGLDV
jgi:hypothetical protein